MSRPSSYRNLTGPRGLSPDDPGHPGAEDCSGPTTREQDLAFCAKARKTREIEPDAASAQARAHLKELLEQQRGKR